MARSHSLDWEILLLLNVDGINISTSTLLGHLKSLGLFKHKSQAVLLEVIIFLQEL